MEIQELWWSIFTLKTVVLSVVMIMLLCLAQGSDVVINQLMELEFMKSASVIMCDPDRVLADIRLYVLQVCRFCKFGRLVFEGQTVTFVGKVGRHKYHLFDIWMSLKRTCSKFCSVELMWVQNTSKLFGCMLICCIHLGFEQSLRFVRFISRRKWRLIRVKASNYKVCKGF